MTTITLRVKVTPGARRETFLETKLNTFEIRVRERAERNEANERVCALLAQHFGVAPERVRIVAGARGVVKRIEVWSASPRQ